MADAAAVNGVTVVCETIPFFESVSFGVWILSGSRDEAEDKNGVSHFLEHLVFKGSPGKSAAQLAMEIDELGGALEAFTTRESTCFAAHVAGSRLEKAFALLSQMILEADFPMTEVELERRVILEELISSEDNPGELAFDRMYAARFLGHPLGRPIGGSLQTVRTIAREDLVDLRLRRYAPPGILVAACGAVKLEEIQSLVGRYLGHLGHGAPRPARSAPVPAPGKLFVRKELEQAHLLVTAPGIPLADKRRTQLLLLHLILGGCVSSRLFQNVRERLGLAYSIQSFHDRYSDCGLTGIYAACASKSLDAIWQASMAELDKLASTPLDGRELDRAKIQAEDSLRMSYESLDSRLSQISGQMIHHGRILPKDEILEDIRSVTAEDLRSLAGDLFGERGSFNVVVVGPKEAGAARLLGNGDSE